MRDTLRRGYQPREDGGRRPRFISQSVIAGVGECVDRSESGLKDEPRALNIHYVKGIPHNRTVEYWQSGQEEGIAKPASLVVDCAKWRRN